MPHPSLQSCQHIPFCTHLLIFFQYKDKNYLVVIARYSNWPIIEQAQAGSKGPNWLFTTYLEHLASQMSVWQMVTLSSPQPAHVHSSNCRAEIAITTVKWFITNNTDPHGSLNTDALHCAILQYQNTPDPIKDFIPILLGCHIPHPTWSETLAARKEAFRNRHMKEAEWWTGRTRLLPLAVGHHICIQSDRSTCEQVGQDRHHHWDRPIWPICSMCRWIW